MSGYLLDTNIISRLAPGKKAPPSPEVTAWFHQQGEAGTLYLSAMTVAEIEAGLRKLHRQGTTERARRLNEWLSGLVDMFGDRILPMDAVVARIVGMITDNARAYNPDLADTIIAATASAYGLTVITENLKHFEPLAGVKAELPDVFLR